MKNTKVENRWYNTCCFGGNHCGTFNFGGNNNYLCHGR